VYEVFIERSAERDLRKLPEETFRRIIDHIRALSQNPRPSGCHKITGSKSDWRIRIGDYRVIYEVDEKEKAVRVMRVRHRREAYR
jgi:mRNA interferase RelE/StbE